MRARISWSGEAQFAGESGSGHTVIMDGPPEAGGHNSGVRPMEMLLLGMGACTVFDVVSILKKARQPVKDCIVELSAERADSPPKVFTHIHAHFIVTGNNLKEAQVKRAIQLSAEKYCSASIMLGKTATMTHNYEIKQDLAGT